MSRNDLIGVAARERHYYVLGPLDADTPWDARSVRRHLLRRQYLYRTRSRARALVHAHDLQRREHPTEYGVRELW
jgi:hypothetical protein